MLMSYIYVDFKLTFQTRGTLGFFRCGGPGSHVGKVWMLIAPRWMEELCGSVGLYDVEGKQRLCSALVSKRGDQQGGRTNRRHGALGNVSCTLIHPNAEQFKCK